MKITNLLLLFSLICFNAMFSKTRYGDGNLDAISGNVSNGTAANGAISTYAADMDGGGDLDVLSASLTDDKIASYKNAALTTLLSLNPTANAANVGLNADIVLTFDNPVVNANVNAANIRVHGDQTGTIAGTFSGGGTTVITFNPTQDFKPGELIKVTLTTGLGLTTPTVFSFTTTVSPTSPGQFVNGQNTITTAANGAQSTYAADMDGDGDLDVLSASQNDDKIAWYENLGAGAFGAQQVITTAAASAFSVYAADLDGDGDLDVLSASQNDDKIAWYENLGAGAFGAQQVITTADGGAQSVYAADMDGDGDLDVLSASFGKIAWYENLGAGAFGAQKVITTVTIGADSVYAADLDGDGDLDVLSASASFVDDKIAWYENLGAGAFGAQQVITTAASGAQSVYAADMDGDGDLDVLSASQLDNKIAWYENLGAGTFSAQQVISSAANGAFSVYAADMDGDGDMDVLSASQNDDKIAWYENLGAGAFGAQQVITTAASGAQSVYAADMDGDGDLDVLSASFNDNKIAWYENGTTLSLDDFASEKNLRLYPNPVQNILNVSVNNSLVIDSYEIYNITGQNVGSGNSFPVNGVNVSGLAKGMYMLRLQTDKGVQTKKFIKQ